MARDEPTRYGANQFGPTRTPHCPHLGGSLSCSALLAPHFLLRTSCSALLAPHFLLLSYYGRRDTLRTRPARFLLLLDGHGNLPAMPPGTAEELPASRAIAGFAA